MDIACEGWSALVVGTFPVSLGLDVVVTEGEAWLFACADINDYN